jgi:hypothetical protein
MSEADMLRELFDIAWDIQIHNKDKNEELVKKTIRYMPDIMQQFDYLENKKITPSKTLEELGYEKIQDDTIGIIYKSDEHGIEILFAKLINEVHIATLDDVWASLTMEELKAIYKYCEDLGWI